LTQNMRYAKLVSMTRKSKSSRAGINPGARKAPSGSPGRWPLQDAKARFSELVRRVNTEGPQVVTVHGKDEVVIVAADDYRRLKGEITGQALVDALQSSPHRDVDIAPARGPAPVRDVIL
jgi:prevent-host-death family protein